MHPLDNKFGNRLKSAMRTRGVTQVELAKSLGLTQGHMSHLVTGRRKPSLQLAEAIARELRMTQQELMGDDLRVIETPEEKSLIDALRQLDEEQAKILVALAKQLSDTN